MRWRLLASVSVLLSACGSVNKSTYASREKITAEFLGESFKQRLKDLNSSGVGSELIYLEEVKYPENPHGLFYYNTWYRIDKAIKVVEPYIEGARKLIPTIENARISLGPDKYEDIYVWRPIQRHLDTYEEISPKIAKLKLGFAAMREEAQAQNEWTRKRVKMQEDLLKPYAPVAVTSDYSIQLHSVEHRVAIFKITNLGNKLIRLEPKEVYYNEFTDKSTSRLKGFYLTDSHGNSYKLRAIDEIPEEDQLGRGYSQRRFKLHRKTMRPKDSLFIRVLFSDEPVESEKLIYDVDLRDKGLSKKHRFVIPTDIWRKSSDIPDELPQKP
ncbi:hypothetical protein OAG61_04450 [Akkermansiaceae bacterium]|nr:hypothetical protein [bacterium]MDB4774571.1 hypothetical protein [Akkermansiaceae bacterium]